MELKNRSTMVSTPENLKTNEIFVNFYFIVSVIGLNEMKAALNMIFQPQNFFWVVKYPSWDVMDRNKSISID